MKYFTPSKWISRIMVSWGIVTICTAAVSSYEGLIVCRVFLGVAEAGFFVRASPYTLQSRLIVAAWYHLLPLFLVGSTEMLGTELIFQVQTR
jgi:hypothetical protein